MANRKLFSTKTKAVSVPHNTVNQAGGKAYSRSAEETLCQFAVSNCFNGTYYLSEGEILSELQMVITECSSEMLAKVAVYSRQNAFMKDMPAFILATLAARHEHELMNRVFNKVIDNFDMLCNFMTIVRSGVTGRKSFGSSVKRLIQEWLFTKSPTSLFRSSIGQANPSMADVLRMVHPSPTDVTYSNLFAYFLDKEFDFNKLPGLVQEFEVFKKDNTAKLPDVPFRALTNCNLTQQHWKEVALSMPPNTLRQNLNMLGKHGIYNDDKVVNKLYENLANPEWISTYKVFPYQLYNTFKNVSGAPVKLTNALQQALETAVLNIGSFNKKVAVCIDVSGSMYSPATGNRNGATTSMTCVEVAGLFMASILKNNKEADVIFFSDSAQMIRVNAYNSVMNIVQSMPHNGGGTNCGSAIHLLNQSGNKYDLVIMISDNQSWVEFMGTGYGSYYGNRSMSQEWNTFKGRNKNAKLVVWDITPNTSTQMPSIKDVLNVGGFNDKVFNIIHNFVDSRNLNFVDVIKNTEI